MKLKSGIYFTNNTTSNLLGKFSLIAPSIFFEVQNNNLIYSKGKTKLKCNLFWSLSLKSLINEPLGDRAAEIIVRQNNETLAKYPVNLHDKEEIFGDEIAIELKLKDLLAISIEFDKTKEILISSGFLVVNEV